MFSLSKGSQIQKAKSFAKNTQSQVQESIYSNTKSSHLGTF